MQPESNGALVPTSTIPKGVVAREEFGGREITALAETTSTAVAARAKALVEARYVMALQRPRDMDVVRDRLLKECKRPGFAEVARYAKPIGGGKKAEGFSIRFMEAAARCYGNIDIAVSTIYEDAARRIVEVSVVDLEANINESITVPIEKTVERTALKDGQEAISVRTNSQGKQTYLVRATEDDLLAKANAHISKAKRNAIKHLVPGDILDECESKIDETLRNRDAADPNAARKKLADVFSAIGVSPAELKTYLGHSLDGCQPAELAHLRQLYQALKDGETSWREVMAEREPKDEAKKSSLDEKIAKKATEAAAAKTEPESEATIALAITADINEADTLAKLAKARTRATALTDATLRDSLLAKADARRETWGK